MEQERHRLARAGEVEVVSGEDRFADREGPLQEPLGVVDPVPVVGDAPQVVQGLGHPRVTVSPEPLLERQRAPQSSLRFVEKSLLGERRAQVVEHGGDLGVF
jgi:hypothetical protein